MLPVFFRIVACHERDEVIDVKRFTETRGGVNIAASGLRIGSRCHHNDRGMRLWLLTVMSRECPSVHHGHTHIQKDDIRLLTLHTAQGYRAILGGEDQVAFIFQYHAHKISDAVIILDDQYRASRCHVLALPHVPMGFRTLVVTWQLLCRPWIVPSSTVACGSVSQSRFGYQAHKRVEWCRVTVDSSTVPPLSSLTTTMAGLRSSHPAMWKHRQSEEWPSKGAMPVAQDQYDQVDLYLREHRSAHLRSLKELLAIPSISTLPAHAGDMRAAAQTLVGRMTAIGLEDVTLHETGGHPAVSGSWLHAPGKPTVLVYGHYDVQPVDPLHLWTTPPFEPTERNGKLFARGASDDKGQVWMHLMVVEALLQVTGGLPLNMKFLIEGEEEIGSRNLPAFVANHRDLLAADVIVISDTPMFAPGVPTLCYGLRGLAALEIHLTGSTADLHSGLFGGSVQNPLHALATLIASLHDAHDRVTVPGFYDDVQPLSADERAAFAKLPHDDAAYIEQLGVPAVFGEEGYTTLERTWARPTLEINGMWGGFTGEGSKTIVPSSAHAKITCRLVPHQQPERISAAVAAFLEANCPPGVRLTIDTKGYGSPATVTPIDSFWMRAAARAMQRAYGVQAGFIRMGGSIGVAPTFTDVLGAPLVLMGFGLPDEQFHAPNERFDLGNYDRGERTLAAYWLELGAHGQGASRA